MLQSPTVALPAGMANPNAAKYLAMTNPGARSAPVPQGAAAPSPVLNYNTVSGGSATGSSYQNASSAPSAGAHPSSPAPTPGSNGTNPIDPTGVDPQVAAFNKFAGDTATQLGAGGFDPKQASNFYKEASAPIEQNFMQQADQTAAYLARQGLGGSGINISANSSLNSNRSSLESQAALKSQDLARELQRRSLLDSFSTKAMGMSTVLQNKGIDVNSVIAQMQMNEQMKMFEEQMQAQADAGTGSFLGSIFNGAAMVGAAAIMSDERMKTNVIRTGVEVVPGVPVAFFQWKNGDKKWHAGVIAQDVQKVMPEAVIERNGLLMVDYGMLRNRSL